MKYKRLALLFLLGISLLAPLFVSATGIDTVFQGLNETNNPGDGAIFKEDLTLGETVKAVIDNIIGLLGAIFLILTAYGGLKIMLSKGEQSEYKSGRQTISYGVIGMIVIVMSYGIVQILFGSILPSLGKN
jgi:Type IV secretion system pilin